MFFLSSFLKTGGFVSNFWGSVTFPRIDLRVGGRAPVNLQAFLSLPPPKAEACKSIEYAMKKCPNGMFSEIKYDGERVQVHKDGDHFSYFSRSLKPVLPHKVRSLPSCQDCLSLLPLRLSGPFQLWYTVGILSYSF